MPRFHHKRAIVAGAVTSLAAPAVASGGVAHAGSITQAGNSSVIATEAADHSLWFYFQPIGSAGWSSQQVAPPDTNQLYVTFDNTIIMNDAQNGWTYDPSGPSLIFHGAACDELRSGMVGSVHVQYGCPPVQ